MAAGVAQGGVVAVGGVGVFTEVGAAAGAVDLAGGLTEAAGPRGLLRPPPTAGGPAVRSSALLRAGAAGLAGLAAVPGSGKGKLVTTLPSGLTSVSSRGLTDFSTKPGANSVPTRYGRGGCPSTATSAAPWPLAPAITPMTLKRSAGPAAAAWTLAGAPSSRAKASGEVVAAALALGSVRLAEPALAASNAASGLALRKRNSVASPQYAADNRAAPTRAAVVQRRPDSECRSIMCCASSPTRALACKLDQRLRNAAKAVRRPDRGGGFTLIELMVVLVIIGVLAALIVPNVLERADDARISAARTDVNNIMQSLRLYRLDNQRYPTAEQGLQALVVKPDKPPLPGNWKAYLERLPNDPWGQPYVYVNPGVRAEIDVLSYGADGQPGGEGKDADVGSWQ